MTIPSQRRYVGYCADLIREELEYKATTIVIKEIRLDPLPLAFNGGQGCLQFVISNPKGKIYNSPIYEVKKGATQMILPIQRCIALTGDIKVEFFNKPKMKRKEKMFHFWFNTFFVREEVADLDKCINCNEEVNMNTKVQNSERANRALSFDDQNKTPQIKTVRTNSLTTTATNMNSTPATTIAAVNTTAAVAPTSTTTTTISNSDGTNNVATIKNTASATSLTANSSDSATGAAEKEENMIVLRLKKSELDDAHKDKQNKHYGPNFQVSVLR